jgi:hypothetical protein
VRFSDTRLQAVQDSARRSSDAAERARWDNTDFEERVSAARIAEFEVEVRGAETAHDLRRRHIDYWETFVKVTDDVPHSFQAVYEPAELAAGGLDEYQTIVRVEALSRPLGKWGHSLEELQKAFDAKDDSVLRGFLEHWNTSNIRDHRPVFAAWRDQVLDEIAAPDWPERLRDRMGLAHYSAHGGPIPVALMQYTVREVRAEAAAMGVSTMFAAPTVLDSAPWEYFFPAPAALPYGRAMALVPVDDEKQLLAEMLHTRLTYLPHHIVALGTIARPTSPHDIKELRNRHLLAVQVASGRGDFGEEMP